MDHATKCYVVLAHVMRVRSGGTDRIIVDGLPQEGVNDCVAVMGDEGLLHATPPGTAYADAWTEGRITTKGHLFLSAFGAELADRRAAVRRDQVAQDPVSTTFEVVLTAMTATPSS